MPLDAAALAGARVVLIQLPRSLDALDEIAGLIAAHADPAVVVLAGGRVKHMTPAMNDVLGRYLGIGRGAPRAAEVPRPRRDRAARGCRASASRWPAERAPHRPRADGLRARRRRSRARASTSGHGSCSSSSTGCCPTRRARWTWAAARACSPSRSPGHVPRSRVTATDESSAAVTSARATAAANGVADRVTVIRDAPRRACRTRRRTSWCSTRRSTSARRSTRVSRCGLFADAARVLRPGGELWVVWNSHLHYRAALERARRPDSSGRPQRQVHGHGLDEALIRGRRAAHRCPPTDAERATMEEFSRDRWRSRAPASASSAARGEHTVAARVPLEIAPGRLAGLRRWNMIAGVLHAASAVAVVALANDFAIPVTASYIEGAPGSSAYSQVTLWEVPLAWGVAVFFILSALAHAWVVSPPGFARYGTDLANGRNYARWVEYSLSSSVMIWLIAQICSVTDVAALIGIFAVNACMILFGWLQEKYEVPGEGGWLPFLFGCFAGAVPWLIIVLLLVRPGYTGDAATPGFVYGIVVSLFLFFNIFALNQWLQYKRVGRWADYVYGERVYITLSLVAKSLLAWQVFAGTLAG